MEIESKKPKKLDVLISLSLNVCASCGTIFVNKFIFQYFEFEFGTLLTVFHFYVTFALTVIVALLKLFQPKKLSILQVLPISLSFCGYVVFNNLSLLFNSVSFYQVMKIFCTPVILAIEKFFYGVEQDKRIYYSLIPVCIGIFISVFTDLEINFIGSSFAVLAIISNSLYTIWGKRKVNKLDAGPLQVLLYNSIMSAIILTFAVPFFDDTFHMKSFFRDDFSFGCGFWILVSCFTAFFVNFSFFLLVGKTSPLTVNMVGYFKTCIVFFGGIILFQNEYSLKNLFGIVVTLLGLGYYTWIKVIIQQEKEIPILPTTADETEEKKEIEMKEANEKEKFDDDDAVEIQVEKE